MASPQTLPEFLEQTETFRRKPDAPLWYRGCGLVTYELLPSLYRHPTRRTPEGYRDLERQLIARFRQRSIPYHSRNLADDWDTLFFMQHYGVPTRLLDWTENPLIALHFALMGAIKKWTVSGKVAFESEAVVWILDPISWNRHALRHVS